MEGSRVAGVRGVLFTDVVDSTRLRTELGEDRADDLRRHHDELIGAAVSAHGGEVVRWTGDGVKASFASASAAVAAAIDVQRAVERYARRSDAVAAFQVRIGLSVGEVVDEDGDIHGVAVIEGARLEALAAPGEIFATDLVQRLAQRRVDAEFEEVGQHELKGLDQPVTVLRVVDTAERGLSRPVPRSLAVDQRFPMVGRQDGLAKVLSLWGEVRAGSTATVLLAGPPGIGKSRFLAQVAERTHADGALVLAGVCDSDLAVPYQPFAMAFADVSTSDEVLAAAVDDGGGPLGPLFPARRAGRFEDGGPSARFELFDAVAGLIDRLAEDQPVVLVLEDLHWATSPTVQLLRHLVRHATGARVLVLASYRTEEVGPTHPLQDVLADAHGSSAIGRFELGALTFEDVVELVVDRVPEAPSESVRRFAERVCDESGGSPFFVCELLLHLAATGQLARLVDGGAGAELPVPDSVRDVVGQRLGRLPSDARELLASAAVVGHTFDLELVSTLVSRSPEDVLADLEDMERTSLVHEIEAGRFAFDHAIVRNTLLDTQSATRRALAHRRVAEALQQLQRSEHDELAHHWLLAGDEATADHHLELAAQRDLEALAYESAAERYQAVLDHQARRSVPDQLATARSWLGLGLAQRAMTEPDYIVAVIEAGRRGRKLRDVDVVAEAAIASIWPGTYFVTAGATQTGLVELCEDALELIPDEDPRRARILCTLAAHLTYDDDRARRVALLGEAVELAHRNGDPELVGGVLVAEFLALWDPTTIERRAVIAEEVGRMARASGDVDLQFFAGFFAAYCSAERGDVAAALGRLDRLAEVAAASRSSYFGFLTERLGVSLDLFRCRPDMQKRVNALADRYDATQADTGGTWALHVGDMARQSGTLSTLVPTLRTMVAESAISENWLAPFGVALVEAGAIDEAMVVFDSLPEPQLDFFWLATTQVVAELAVGLDRQDAIPGLFERLAPHRHLLGISASGSMVVGLVATTLGMLALAAGHHDSAVDLLEEAVARADEIEAPFEAVRARRLLATALIGLGDPQGRAGAVVATALTHAVGGRFEGERALLAAMAETAGSPA